MRPCRVFLLLLGFALLASALTIGGCGCGEAPRSGTVQGERVESRAAQPPTVSGPLRVTKIYSKPVDVRFKGFVVRAGGDPQVIDPEFWDLQLNYQHASDTQIVGLDGVWHGYKLGPLEKVEAPRPSPEFPPQRYMYVLTIQRPGGQPLKLAMNRWLTTSEAYADLVVTQGKDTGQVFTGKTVGQTLPVNDTLYLITEISENAVVIKGPGEESYELRPDGEEQGAAAGPDDDDKDGMPNDWEDQYKGTDRTEADADEDPDGDGFSNLKEYLGFSDPDDPGSIPNPLHLSRTPGKPVDVRPTRHLVRAGANPDDPRSIPFRVTRIYKKPADVRFRGYVVRVGGDPDVIDPKFWDVQLNYGRESQTAIVPLDDMWQGFRLGPLEKIQVPARPGGRPREDYALTIQRPGGQPFKLGRSEWVAVDEPCADLVVTQGRDDGKTFTGVVVGQSLRVNGEQYRVADISEEGVSIGKPTIAGDPDR